MPATVLPDGTLTLYSNVLGLELRLAQGVLRFVNPTTGQQLLSHREAEHARQEAEHARQEAEEHARREAAARAEAEARLAVVEAQLRTLREQGEGPHNS